jgi:AcrR family transcriptional regulator
MERWFRFAADHTENWFRLSSRTATVRTMSSTEPRPQRADARRNRERIVDAARELFAECGDTTQMDDVARRAQVGVGTVYRHFPTKAALLGELMAAKFRHHTEVARRWAAEEVDGWTAFEGFVRESFAAMATDASLRQRVAWREEGEGLERAEQERQILSGVVGEIIERAQAQGRLSPDFTADDMPAFMCAAGSVIAASQATPIVRGDRFLELLIDAVRVA